MTLTEYYQRDRDEADGIDARKAVFRTYSIAVLAIIDERNLAPSDPLRWRRAAVDAGLPEPYLPRWRAMSGEELMALYDTLCRARSVGEE